MSRLRPLQRRGYILNNWMALTGTLAERGQCPQCCFDVAPAPTDNGDELQCPF